MSKTVENSNPNWDQELAWEPGRVSGVMVVHIPHLTGYYENMLEVLDLSLETWSYPGMHRIIYLNGCCSEVRDLVRSHVPSFILESLRNVGAINALFQAVRFAPGEVIAYSDYDVEYDYGWLPRLLEILDTYPRAGMVSGNCAGWSAEHCAKAAKGLKGKWKNQDLEALKQWAASVKWKLDACKTRAKTDRQWHTSKAGVKAVVGAKHYQFVALRSRLLEIDPGYWPHRMRGHVPVLDEAMDAAGYLRLSTPDPVCWHLGNKISV